METLNLAIGQELTVADLFETANISSDFMDDFTERLKSGSSNVDNFDGTSGKDIHVVLVSSSEDYKSVVRISSIDSI